MEVIEKVIPYYWSDDFHLYLLADDHMGTKHHASKALKRQIDAIKADKRAMWLHLGDKGEFIATTQHGDLDAIFLGLFRKQFRILVTFGLH